ncbi:bifunctional histidinol-phosphatase/imidazoleglycerol-phosphate dehydratase HisB [Deinococcus lacus]|uniref:Histidine biosynthesis bifunctional protein HisB n=1 Tax=Deinococcus lacus TaxID=392561 RepID=A0ABW1YF70_9DEIO
MQPTLFLDRDGTLIAEPQPDQQVSSLAKLAFEPMVVPALLQLAEAGFRLVIVTNQDGLGTESFPQADFDPPHQMMLDVFASQGITFSEVYICPHFPSEKCVCRKPGVGLVLGELRERRFDPQRSYVIGDRETDLALAQQMGITGLLYRRCPGQSWLDLAGQILAAPRTASLNRTTRETAVTVSVNLSSPGPIAIRTGLGFFDHMLEQIAVHGGFSLQLTAEGDLQVDEHHTVEDTALALGSALAQALGDKRGIGRYGFVLPMDEVRAECLLDLSGRPYLDFEAQFTRDQVGGLDTSLIQHFFHSLSQTLGATLHLKAGSGNAHHQVEALFKAFGRALRQCIRLEGRSLPSSKGTL